MQLPEFRVFLVLTATCFSSSLSKEHQIGKTVWPCVMIESINGSEISHNDQIFVNLSTAIGIVHKIQLRRNDNATAELLCFIDGINQTLSLMTSDKEKITCSGLAAFFQPTSTIISQDYANHYRKVLSKQAVYGPRYFSVSADTLAFTELGFKAQCEIFFKIPIGLVDVSLCSLAFPMLFILFFLH